ncbi:MAG: DUF805 domain-containing protein [Actinobacteria bacterium]|uniref:Unannotated protein n=1 Tax=freshwater metagenome TaxID=449393 RepID=A0A6J7GB03_9ZZZZ|nr:DUF805 domain-containing protein [Actinomycetota bacterium]
MTFGQAIASGFKNYVSWKGRATRSEFWFWHLFVFIVDIPFIVIYNVVTQSELQAALVARDWAGFFSDLFGWSFWLLVVVSLIFILPTIAVLIRRLHDLDRSGAWFWIGLVPSAGGIILFIFSVLPGTPGKNRFDA